MWAVVINPVAGQGRGALLGTEVAGYLSRNKLEYQIVTGNSVTTLTENFERFLKRNPNCQGVFSVGGDGLAHILLQKVTPLQIPMAVIPGGTGNDLVRTFGWPLDSIDGYLDYIISHDPTSIDLGLVDGEWFGAILSTGFDSVVNERANTLKWPKGPNKYNAAIAIELPRFRPRQYEITLDDRTISTEAMLIAVANGTSYGGGMKVCPDADIRDGLFDVMILHPISKLEFMKVFPRVFKGTHISHPQVEIVRSSKVRIEAQAVAYADGERIGQLPIQAECVRNVFNTWLP